MCQYQITLSIKFYPMPESMYVNNFEIFIIIEFCKVSDRAGLL